MRTRLGGGSWGRALQLQFSTSIIDERPARVAHVLSSFTLLLTYLHLHSLSQGELTQASGILDDHSLARSPRWNSPTRFELVKSAKQSNKTSHSSHSLRSPIGWRATTTTTPQPPARTTLPTDRPDQSLVSTNSVAGASAHDIISPALTSSSWRRLGRRSHQVKVLRVAQSSCGGHHNRLLCKAVHADWCARARKVAVCARLIAQRQPSARAGDFISSLVGRQLSELVA